MDVAVAVVVPLGPSSASFMGDPIPPMLNDTLPAASLETYWLLVFGSVPPIDELSMTVPVPMSIPVPVLPLLVVVVVAIVLVMGLEMSLTGIVPTVSGVVALVIDVAVVSKPEPVELYCVVVCC